jgi:hypothetical protein
MQFMEVRIAGRRIVMRVFLMGGWCELKRHDAVNDIKNTVRLARGFSPGVAAATELGREPDTVHVQGLAPAQSAHRRAQNVLRQVGTKPTTHVASR